MNKRIGPPGWQPHEVTSRLDGWIIDPEHKGRIPAPIAELIANVATASHRHGSITDVRARMRARHRIALRHHGVLSHDL
jgi:hypothetical protein